MSDATAALRRLAESFRPQMTVEVRVEQLLAVLDQQDALAAKIERLEHQCDLLLKACANVQAASETPGHRPS